ncbi:MAG TPA: ATP-binding protein, partial [Ohtaekwangia sp.]|nr:ATP-binding protein [Ohtaekwangia sp.]
VLPEGYNRQIVLIFKEAMTNTLKHSHCKTTWFGAEVMDDDVVIFFEDDGKGLQTGEGQGLRNMQRRAAMINAVVSVVSGNYGGVKVQVRIKMKRYAENG